MVLGSFWNCDNAIDCDNTYVNANAVDIAVKN